MESNIISASDLLKNLSEDYQSYEKDFVFCQTEKELKKAKFRLLLSIVFKEYTKAIDDIDIIDTKEIPKKETEEDSDVFETSCADRDFSPMVSPNGNFGISLKNTEKNSLPSDSDDSEVITDTCHIYDTKITKEKTKSKLISKAHKKNIDSSPDPAIKMNKNSPVMLKIRNKFQSSPSTPSKLLGTLTYQSGKLERRSDNNFLEDISNLGHESCLPATPKFTSTVLAVERTVLAEDSSDGSFQGSPSILSRKKKRSKIASSSIFDAQNPHSSSSKEMEETNAKNESCKSRNNESKSSKISEQGAAPKPTRKNYENDSFDEYEPIEDENAWKYANVPVKKKSEREKLKGFSCDDCEQYYKNANLTEEQLQKLLQKCSKHRATLVPDPVSPKEMWELDITGPPDKTQVGSPLKTRERRKMYRQQMK